MTCLAQNCGNTRNKAKLNALNAFVWWALSVRELLLRAVGTGHVESSKEKGGREHHTNGQQRVTTNGQSQAMLSIRMAVMMSLLSSIFHTWYVAVCFPIVPHCCLSTAVLWLQHDWMAAYLHLCISFCCASIRRATHWILHLITEAL